MMLPIPGWTLASDDSYTLNFAQPAKFADDGKINAWAKQSVYYANAKGIILGTGNNMFSPAANAARQEALTIAVRMVEKLKGEAVDYTKGEAPTPTPTPTPSEEVNQRLIGTWYLGDSTLEIRRILRGNYGDIRRISFGYVGISYTFNENGTYLMVSIIGTQVSTLSSGQLVVSEGQYSVSNGVITLKNITTKATSNPNVPFEWEHITNPPDETHSFEFGYDSDRERDKLYLDGNNDPGYTRTLDV